MGSIHSFSPCPMCDAHPEVDWAPHLPARLCRNRCHHDLPIQPLTVGKLDGKINGKWTILLLAIKLFMFTISEGRFQRDQIRRNIQKVPFLAVFVGGSRKQRSPRIAAAETLQYRTCGFRKTERLLCPRRKRENSLVKPLI